MHGKRADTPVTQGPNNIIGVFLYSPSACKCCSLMQNVHNSFYLCNSCTLSLFRASCLIIQIGWMSCWEWNISLNFLIIILGPNKCFRIHFPAADNKRQTISCIYYFSYYSKYIQMWSLVPSHAVYVSVHTHRHTHTHRSFRGVFPLLLLSSLMSLSTNKTLGW